MPQILTYNHVGIVDIVATFFGFSVLFSVPMDSNGSYNLYDNNFYVVYSFFFRDCFFEDCFGV